MRWITEIYHDFLVFAFCSVPDPAHLTFVLPSLKEEGGGSKHGVLDQSIVFVKPRKVAAILVPSGLGIRDWAGFGQCLCIDWFPGNQHTRIAAGYYNGI